MSQLGFSAEQWRRLLLCHLQGEPYGSNYQINGLNIAIGTLAVKLGYASADSPALSTCRGELYGVPMRALGNHDTAKVVNALWDLIIAGIVRPGDGRGEHSLPFFHLTEWGEKVVAGERNPYDPDGYLSRIRAEVPDVDPVVMTYLAEALHTFRVGCLLSSAVCLGCASEKALLLLVEAVAGHLQGEARSKFVKATAGKFIKTQFDELRAALAAVDGKKLGRDLRDQLDVKLNGIFSMIREQRNDAGHPTGVMPDREHAYALVTVFPSYLGFVYELIGWLRANTTPS